MFEKPASSSSRLDTGDVHVVWYNCSGERLYWWTKASGE